MSDVFPLALPMELLRRWMENDWLCWGLGPFLSVNLGYFGSCALLEALSRSSWAKESFIEYGDRKREEALELTRSLAWGVLNRQGAAGVWLAGGWKSKENGEVSI